MAKVIVLQGKDNVGKSSTLRELLNTLNMQPQLFTLVAAEDNNLLHRLSNKGDVWAIFKNIKTNKIIGITTRGDSAGCIVADFNTMKKQVQCKVKDKLDCDIYVCAAHLYGKTIDCIVSRFGYQNVYFYGRIEINDSVYNFDIIRKNLNIRDANMLYKNLI